MHPPIGKFSKLSLATSGMAPVTRSQRHQSGEGSSGAARAATAATSSALPSSSMMMVDEEDYEEDGPVRSPLTKLFYNTDNLDDETAELVRELFRRPAPEETPPMVIEWCGISNDPDVYAFQLQEVVPRTIRIGSPTSRIPKPLCNCMGTAPDSKPCRHLVWLMDQIAKQTLHTHPPGEPLVLDDNGFPQPLGNDAYARIADFHIDVLANTLHCGAGPPDGRANAARVREAREILAGLAGFRDDETVDAYAPEIFDIGEEPLQKLLWSSTKKRQRQDEEEEEFSFEEAADAEDDDDDDDDDDEEDDGGEEEEAGDASDDESDDSERRASERRLIERGDLQRTVLRLLVSNDEFFAMFLKLLAPYDKIRDPFRKIQQRVECVLEALRRRASIHRQVHGGPHGHSHRHPSSSSSSHQRAAAIPPSLQNVTVAWAAQHVENAIEQIRLLLDEYMSRPSKPRRRGAYQHQHQHQHQQAQSSQHRAQHPVRARSVPLWVRPSAARALFWIFRVLVFHHNRDAHPGATQDDRNLYQRLIGNAGAGIGVSEDTGGGAVGGPSAAARFFLLDELEPLHDQVQYRTELEKIRRRIEVNGYREVYMHRLNGILTQMRTVVRTEQEGESEQDSDIDESDEDESSDNESESSEDDSEDDSEDADDNDDNDDDDDDDDAGSDSDDRTPTQLPGRGQSRGGRARGGPVGGGGSSSRAGRRKGRDTASSAAGSKRQGSGTGTFSDRRVKRMR